MRRLRGGMRAHGFGDVAFVLFVSTLLFASLAGVFAAVLIVLSMTGGFS